MASQYLYPSDNLALTATPTLPVGSLVSGYALSTLSGLDPMARVLFGAVTIGLLWDMGSAQRIDTWIWPHHNFSGGTYRLQAHTSADMTAPTLDKAITVPAADLDGMQNPASVDAVTADYGAFPLGLRYWYQKITGNAANVIMVPPIFAAAWRSIELLSALQEGPDRPASSTLTDAEIELTYDRSITRHPFVAPLLLNGTGTSQAAYDALQQATRGRAKAFPFRLESTAPPRLVRFESSSSPTERVGQLARGEFAVKEISRGRRL